MDYIFKDCKNLVTIPEISKWNNPLMQENASYIISSKKNSEKFSSIDKLFPESSLVYSSNPNESINNQEKDIRTYYIPLEKFNEFENNINEEINKEFYDNFYA